LFFGQVFHLFLVSFGLLARRSTASRLLLTCAHVKRFRIFFSSFFDPLKCAGTSRAANRRIVFRLFVHRVFLSSFEFAPASHLGALGCPRVFHAARASSRVGLLTLFGSQMPQGSQPANHQPPMSVEPLSKAFAAPPQNGQPNKTVERMPAASVIADELGCCTTQHTCLYASRSTATDSDASGLSPTRAARLRAGVFQPVGTSEWRCCFPAHHATPRL